MVLIFSDPNDSTTNLAIGWLNNKNCKYKRINYFNNALDFHLEIENNGAKVFSKEEPLYSIWYRRLPKINIQLEDKECLNSRLKSEILFQARNEYYSLYDSLFTIHEKKRVLGNPFLNELNKVYQLQIAKKYGLNIPRTLITDSKKHLVNFKKKARKIVIKPLKNSFFHIIDNKIYKSYTALVTDSLIRSLNKKIFPSFFQEYIEKKFEVRSFYMDGKFYSMAIFSQADKQTKIDFRKYNILKPNRTIPYQLPKVYEKKLHDFMIALGLNTGSIDIIVNKKGKHFFLEVNPDGQFGMVSYPCNYYLEKKVIEYLIGN